MSDIEFLKERGISSPYATAVMPYHFDDAKNIVVDYDKMTPEKMAQDAALSGTVPNVGVPSVYLTHIDPQITTILFSPMNATKLFGQTSEVRKGTWTDQFMMFPIEEITGSVTPYSDFTSNVSSDVNYNYPSRENFLFQTSLKYGDRELETSSKAKLQLASSKQRAAASVLARAHNKFYLYGVSGKQVVGALNDPNLNAVIAPVTVNSKTTWEDKLADQTNTATFANVVYNDIVKLINELLANADGNLDANTRFILAVATDRYSYLSIPNQFSKTAISLLKENFPNLEIIQLPELVTETGSMLYLTVPTFDGEPTAECAYSEKMRMSNLERHMSYSEQKAMGGTWGCVIRRPNFIARMTGI